MGLRAILLEEQPDSAAVSWIVVRVALFRIDIGGGGRDGVDRYVIRP